MENQLVTSICQHVFDVLAIVAYSSGNQLTILGESRKEKKL
jgi:hypothetical protein